MIRLVVVDLDGTLIPGNSFHAWLRYLGWWAVTTGQIRVAFRLALICFNRARRSISHRQLKFQVLLISESIPEAVADRFSRRLVDSIRSAVAAAVVDAAQEGLTVVLATAAPQFYLAGVAQAIGAYVAVGTPPSTTVPWREAMGPEKLERVMSMFEPGTEIALVFTDHLDDLPLVARAKRSVIVGPTPENWAGFVRSGAPVALLKVRP